MASGKFITFEGGEGAGKSTQMRRLAVRLRSLGLKVIETREPGGTERGEQIREFILSGKARDYGPLGEAVLFSSARDTHIQEVIAPALERDEWVLCDRFSDSTAAYQGAGGGVKPALIRALERVAVGSAMPVLTLLLDLPVEAGLKRIAERNGGGAEITDRFEGMERRFHEALRECFLQIAAETPYRSVIIDAQQDEAAVGEDIWQAVTERLSP